MAKIKAVLFDLDNTLIDFWGAKVTSIDAAVDAMIKSGLKMSKKEAHSTIFELYKKYGIEHGKIFQKFLLKTNGKIDMHLLSAGIVAYRNVQKTYHKPYDGAEKTIKLLKKKGYRLAIVSNAPPIKAWIRLTEIGLADYFDAIIASDSGKKPSPRPFKAALRRLKVRPYEVLYVGDDPRRDIRGAKKIGMKTALALYGINKLDEKYIQKYEADHNLKRPQDILFLLQKQ